MVVIVDLDGDGDLEADATFDATAAMADGALQRELRTEERHDLEPSFSKVWSRCRDRKG